MILKYISQNVTPLHLTIYLKDTNQTKNEGMLIEKNYIFHQFLFLFYYFSTSLIVPLTSEVNNRIFFFKSNKEGIVFKFRIVFLIK